MPAKRRFRCSLTFDVLAENADRASYMASAVAFETELNWPNLIVDPENPAREGKEKVWVQDVSDMGDA